MAAERPIGTLYGIGVGPGDPELITVKAVRLLERVEHVFVPRRMGGRSLARSIAAPYLDPARQTIVELDHQMGGPGAEACWVANAERIVSTLAAGHDAAFLTEGDPLLYSTFILTLRAIEARRPGVPVVVVPGVSSIFGAAAAARTPIAEGSDRIAILPALAEPADLAAILDRFETVVLLKAGRSAARIAAWAATLDPPATAVFVERATWPGEVVIRDAAALAGRANDYFSLLIVRKGATPA